MTRGRKPIPVSKEELQNVVDEVESTGPFTSRNALWAKVAATEYAKGINLSPQVAMLKAQKFGIVIQTPIGKRGRAKGSGPVATVGPRKRKCIPLELVEPLKATFQESLHKKVDRAAKGSIKAAVGLKCVSCAESKKEVALCTITLCPLWSFRPYRHRLSMTAEGRAKIQKGV